MDLRYDYHDYHDGQGQDMDLRMAVTDKRRGEKTSYVYDLMNRLSSATTREDSDLDRWVVGRRGGLPGWLRVSSR